MRAATQSFMIVHAVAIERRDHKNALEYPGVVAGFGQVEQGGFFHRVHFVDSQENGFIPSPLEGEGQGGGWRGNH